MPEPGPRPSTGITRFLRYHEPLRLPRRPEAGPFGSPRLVVATHRRRGSRTLPRKPCAHADSNTPAGEDGFSDRLLPRPPTAFPLCQEGRLQRATIEACSEFTRFGLRTCTLVAPGSFPEASAGRLLASTAPVATGACRQLPGRDLHPLAFETQKVSDSTTPTHPDLLSCRTDKRWSKQGNGRGPLPCSHLYLSNRLRQPRFRSLAAGTGARAAAPQSLYPWITARRRAPWRRAASAR